MTTRDQSEPVSMSPHQMDSCDSDFDSTDDPDHLWCICKQPHNNRFMICCGVCKDLFHGGCVGVSQKQGREWEKYETEWICSNCQTNVNGTKVDQDVIPSSSVTTNNAEQKNHVRRDKSKRTGRQGCSVLGCNNNYLSTFGLQPPVHFYKFPKRSHEKERKRKWIRFTARKNVDESPWVPSLEARICSRHFINNRRSESVDSPSYIPTIFNVDESKSGSEIYAEYERIKRRKPGPPTVTVKRRSTRKRCLAGQRRSKGTDKVESKVKKARTKEIACQTEEPSVQGSLANCYSNDIPLIARHTPQKDAETGTDDSRLIDRLVGPNYRSVIFVGFASVQHSEDALRNLTSVSSSTFNYLLSLLAASQSQSMCLRIEDRLLMFLMKISHGLSFKMLGTLFNVHRSTASRVFLSLLELLATKTKNLIVWQSKRTILQTLPKYFVGDYSECRAIIESVEIRCQCPANVLHKNLMWNESKQTWTVKFLVAAAPDGVITFISPCYCGSAEDSFIMRNCGFLQKIKHEDLVISAKGLPHLKDEAESRGIFIVLPILKPEDPKFPEKITTHNNVSVRNQVEKIIQSIRSHDILNLRFSSNLLPHVDSVVHVCTVLSNMKIYN